jgi:type II secretory pathway component PulF
MSRLPPEQLDYAARGRLARPVVRGRDRSPARRLAMTALNFAGFRLLIVFFAGLLLAGLWNGIAPAVSIVTGIFIFVMLPAWAGTMRQIRRRRATVVIGFLEQAARLNLPLARMLDAAQRSETARTAKRLRRLRDLLEDGAPLDLALRAGVPEVTPRVIALLGAAERLGRLQPALTVIVRDQRADAETDDDQPARGVLARWYPVLMVCALTFILVFVMIFVVPKMEDMFRDFGLRLPPASRLMIQFARDFANSYVWPWVTLFVLVMILGGTFQRIFTDRADIPRFHWTDHVLWRLPVAHGLQRDRGLADACRVIADALATGRHLPRAIEEAAQLDLNAVLRGRLNKWRQQIESGLPADDAARRARLPRLIPGMLGSGRGGDPTAAAEFLASYYAGRFSRARELLRAAAGPLLVFAFGGIVLFLVAGMYQPILNLMDTLGGAVGRMR